MRSTLFLIGKAVFSLLGLGYAFLGEYLNGSGIAELIGLSSAWNTRLGVIVAAIGFFLTLLQEKQDHEEKLSERDKRIAALEEKLNDRQLRERKLSYAKCKLRELGIRAETLAKDEPPSIDAALRFQSDAGEFLKKALNTTYVHDFGQHCGDFGNPMFYTLLPDEQTGKILRSLYSQATFLRTLADKFKPEELDKDWTPPEGE